MDNKSSEEVPKLKKTWGKYQPRNTVLTLNFGAD
jgi:hypothetical protein